MWLIAVRNTVDGKNLFCSALCTTMGALLRTESIEAFHASENYLYVQYLRSSVEFLENFPRKSIQKSPKKPLEDFSVKVLEGFPMSSLEELLLSKISVIVSLKNYSTFVQRHILINSVMLSLVCGVTANGNEKHTHIFSIIEVGFMLDMTRFESDWSNAIHNS